jgi:hypothetical protein
MKCLKGYFLGSLMLIAMLSACVGVGSAQTLSNDLLQTGSGTQEDLSSLGLGTVTFNGVPLSTDTGPADTIVQHNAIPAGGGTVNIQVIALHLQNSGTVICNNQAKCGSHYGQAVDVHATINVASATNGHISLPQPDSLDASVGTMTVSSDLSTFNSSFTNIEADIIVVAVGAGVTGTPIFTSKGPAASMSASGGTLSSTAPANYPVSQNFPTVSPYVISLAGGTAALLMGPTGQVFRGSLWGLGALLMGFALWMLLRTLKNGQAIRRPVYLTMVLALATWLVAWKTPIYPQVVHAAVAKIGCNPVSPEQGLLIKHGAAPASTACQPVATTTTSSQ